MMLPMRPSPTRPSCHHLQPAASEPTRDSPSTPASLLLLLLSMPLQQPMSWWHRVTEPVLTAQDDMLVF